MMSATSRVGRLIARSSSWNASPHRGWTPRWLPADWESPVDDAGTSAGRRWCDRAWSVQEVSGWCAGRHRLPACVLRSNVDYLPCDIVDTIPRAGLLPGDEGSNGAQVRL